VKNPQGKRTEWMKTVRPGIGVLLVFVLISFIGCERTVPGSHLEPVGIIGALDSEIELLKEKADIRTIRVIAGRVYHEGEIGGRRVVLVKAGVGKVNAAMTAQLLIDKFGVGSVVFTGIAGGINPALHVGDVVISKSVIQHDYGLMSKDGFKPRRIAIADSAGVEISVPYFQPDSLLVAIAESAAHRVDFPPVDSSVSIHGAGPVRSYLGCIVTGDQFIASEEKRVWLEETFGAYATEMEGGAVAQVCVSNNVPFVIVRTLSDLANEDANVDIERFFAYASRNSALLVLEMLRLMP
jgi:adenosylhomocysteine nucleosidase